MIPECLGRYGDLEPGTFSGDSCLPDTETCYIQNFPHQKQTESRIKAKSAFKYAIFILFRDALPIILNYQDSPVSFFSK